MPLPEGELDKLFALAKSRLPNVSWYLEADMLCCQDIDYPGNDKPTAGVYLNLLRDGELSGRERESERKHIVEDVLTILNKVREGDYATSSTISNANQF